MAYRSVLTLGPDAIVDRSPVPYVGRSVSSTYTSVFSRQGGDTRAQLQSYGSNGTLFGIVSRITTAVASVRWKLWRSAASGLDEDRDEVLIHPALSVLKKPNQFFSQRRFIESVEQHVNLTGEGWMLVGRIRGIPAELWFARPDRIRPVVSERDFLLGYIYLSPDGSEEVPLPLADVMPILMPNPDNPYRGLGPVQALMRVLDSARFSEEWNLNFFRNNALPRGVIEVEERLSEDEYNDFLRRWAEAHRGVSGAHRVGILENGMKWVDTNYSVKDMQFAELASLGDDKLRKAFKISKFDIGEVDDVNRATADASNTRFSQAITVPELDRFKDAFNHQFLPLFGSAGVGLEFDYESPVPPDQEQENATLTARAGAAVAMAGAGWKGDALIEAFELPETLIGQWEKPEPPPRVGPDGKPLAPGQGKREEGSKPKKDARLDSWFTGILNIAPELPPGVDLDQVQAHWSAELDRLMEQYVTADAAQRAELQQQIAAAVREGKPEQLAALSVSTVAAASLLLAAMLALAGVSAGQVVAEAAAQGVVVSAGSVVGREMREVATVTAALLGQRMTALAGQEALRRYGPAAEPDELAAAAVAFLGEPGGGPTVRAQLGSALTRAQNAGRHATFARAPEATYWATEKLDKNTCEPCRKINGQELPTLDAALLAYGGGPYLFCQGTVRCRGTYYAVWGERAELTPRTDFADLMRGMLAPPARDAFFEAATRGRFVDFDPMQPRDGKGRWSDGAPSAIMSKAFKVAGQTLTAQFHAEHDKSSHDRDVTLSDEHGGGVRLLGSEVGKLQALLTELAEVGEPGERDWFHRIVTDEQGRPASHIIAGLRVESIGEDGHGRDGYENSVLTLHLPHDEGGTVDPDVLFAEPGIRGAQHELYKAISQIRDQEARTDRTNIGKQGNIDFYRDGRNAVIKPVGNNPAAPEVELPVTDYRKIYKALSDMRNREDADWAELGTDQEARSVLTSAGQFEVVATKEGRVSLSWGGPDHDDHVLVPDTDKTYDFMYGLGVPLGEHLK